MNFPEVIINNISKNYFSGNSKDASVSIIQEFSLKVNNGEFVSIFGPNGCGKTTLLKIISGLLKPNKGEILIKNNIPENASVGFIFQNYRESLYPWRNVYENIALPLEIKGYAKSERKIKVEEILEKLKINIPLKSYPYQLSGGQQQLVAIAQALIVNPDVLLLDEPFSSLDFQTRLKLQDKLLELWELIKIPIIFVSHDIEEAIYLSDNIIFLTERPARILQIIDNPLTRPRNSITRKSKEYFDLVAYALSIFDKQIH